MSSTTSTSKAPLFGLAPCVAVHTPPPPVVLGAKWRSLYPVSSSPFVQAEAQTTKNEHDPVPVPPYIDLAQGVPGHLPSRELLSRFASEEAKHQHHSYRGAPFELADALAIRMNDTYRGGGNQHDGIGTIKREDISITAGCNMASEAAFRMIAQPGGNEAVVLTTPYVSESGRRLYSTEMRQIDSLLILVSAQYFNHAMQLSALNIATAYLPCAAPDFYPDPQQFKDLLDQNRASNGALPVIKGIALVTPNNPTGSIYPPALLAEFARICRDEKIALILDETYREFLVHPHHHDEGSTPAPTTTVQPHPLFQDTLPHDTNSEWDWRSTLIHLYSFSKSFAIPGHRLGAIVCHPILKSIAPFPARPDDDNGSSQQQQHGPLTILLDNTLIAPPRYDTQLALAWALCDDEQIAFRRNVSLDLVKRYTILEQAFERPIDEEEYTTWNLSLTGSSSNNKSAKDLGWEIVSWGGHAPDSPRGGYFVFVRHPFNRVSPSASSLDVAKALSTLTGVGTLPEDFFSPPNKHHADPPTNHLRVSLANVKDNNDLAQVPVRMAILSRLWQSHGRAIFAIDSSH